MHGCHSYRPHSYGHTDPMYPPTLLPLLSTPASLSFLQLQCKEKKAVWLKSKYFFFFLLLKIRMPEIKRRRQGSIGKHLFPRVKRLQHVHCREERLVTLSHPPPFLFLCFFSPLYSSPGYTDPVSLPSPPSASLNPQWRQAEL